MISDDGEALSSPGLPSADTGADTQIAVVATNFDATVIFWSDVASELFGVSRAEALGREVHPHTRWPLAPADYARLTMLGEGSVRVLNYEFTDAQGHTAILKATVTVAIGADGELEIVSAFQRMDAAVPADFSYPNAPRGLGGLSEINFFCDISMVIEYAGPSLVEIFGYQQREVVGKHIFDFIHADDHSLWLRAWDAVMKDPSESGHVQLRVLHNDGQVLWIEETMTNKLDDPDIAAVVVKSRNITDLRRAEEILAAAEQTLLSVLETSLEGVWIVDATGSTVFANERLAELLDVSRGRLLQSSLHQLADVELSRILSEQNVIRPAGVREQLEMPISAGGGGIKWIRVAIAPRYSHVGEFAGSIVMCSDVTNQRNLGTTGPLARLLQSGGSYPSETAHDVQSIQVPDERSVRDAIGESLNSVSPRELDVVTRLVMGDRVPAIAERLYVSQSTVRNQLSSVFRKVGVRSQQDLIALLRGDLDEDRTGQTDHMQV